VSELETELQAVRQDAERRTRTIQGLRDLATFLEANPELPIQHYTSMMISVQEKSELQSVARIMGEATKQMDGEWVSLIRMFGEIKYEVFIDRAKVCGRTVVGIREVPARVEEIVEWKCGTIFGGGQ
jgi:hypothetical protein